MIFLTFFFKHQMVPAVPEPVEGSKGPFDFLLYIQQAIHAIWYILSIPEYCVRFPHGLFPVKEYP